MIWLGKIVSPEGPESIYFHRGVPANVRNSDDPVFVKAILRFLAVNLGKTISVVTEERLEELTDESYQEIGDETAMGPLMEKFIERFQG